MNARNLVRVKVNLRYWLLGIAFADGLVIALGPLHIRFEWKPAAW